jgi:hypothetical protein
MLSRTLAAVVTPDSMRQMPEYKIPLPLTRDAALLSILVMTGAF